MNFLENPHEFWQWDTGIKLQCDDLTVGTEIHIETPYKIAATVVTVQDDHTAEIPDEVFVHAGTMRVFAVDSREAVMQELRIRINRRRMPEDYVNRPTMEQWRDLDDRISELETGGASEEDIERAVEDYLKAHPATVDLSAYRTATAQDAIDAAQSAKIAEKTTLAEVAEQGYLKEHQSLEGYARTEDIPEEYDDTALRESIDSKLDKETFSTAWNQATSAMDGFNTAIQRNTEALAGKVDVGDTPTAMKNPYPLTINGQEYDGSEAVEMSIEGGSGVESAPPLVADFTLNGDAVSKIVVDKDLNGNSFDLKECCFYICNIVFDDTTKKGAFGLTSSGNSQRNGIISPTNVSGVGGAAQVKVSGRMIRRFENFYDFQQQMGVPGKPPKTGVPAYNAAANMYGGFSIGLLIESGEGGEFLTPRDIRIAMMGNDAPKFAEGTRIRIWGR